MPGIDTHRELRTGYPEVIFGQGKTPEQVKEIIRYMATRNNNILATRVTEEMYEAVRDICPEAVLSSGSPGHNHPEGGYKISGYLYCRHSSRNF